MTEVNAFARLRCQYPHIPEWHYPVPIGFCLVFIFPFRTPRQWVGGGLER